MERYGDSMKVDVVGRLPLWRGKIYSKNAF